MKWFKKLWAKLKKVAPTAKIEYHHHLCVQLKGGQRHTWYFVRDKNMGPVALWKPFVKWWFAKDTPYFVIVVPDRRIVIVRNSIDFFDLEVEEHRVPPVYGAP